MFYRGLLIYVFLQHALSSTAEQCSDPTITIEYVNACPESSTAWHEAAQKKNCSTYGKTCADNKALKYHCVMNTYRNATLEICAPDVLIVGHYCPEYNEYGQLIQEHYGTNCKTCPYYYYSTKVYEYPYCFQYQNVEEKNTTPLTTDKDYTTSVESTSIQSAFESTANSISVIASTTSTSKGPYRDDGCCSNFFKDKLTGACKPCWTGYHGKNCSQKCKYPLYGAKCKSLCNCGKGNVTGSIISGTGTKSFRVTKEVCIVTGNGLDTIRKNPIIYGIISVGILAAILLSVYCTIRLRNCILPVFNPI